MSSSDWLAVFLALVGVVLGSGVALVLFRAQQKTDFRAFDQKLGEIVSSVVTLRENTRLASHIDVARELGTVRSSVDSLSATVGSLAAQIIRDVREQQVELLKSVQGDFDRHVAESRTVLRNSLEKELGSLLPNSNQAILMGRLVDLATDALNAMGRFQRVAIEQQSRNALERVEERVADAVSEVGSQISEVREQIDALEQPLALPALPPSTEVEDT